MCLSHTKFISISLCVCVSRCSGSFVFLHENSFDFPAFSLVSEHEKNLVHNFNYRAQHKETFRVKQQQLEDKQKNVNGTILQFQECEKTGRGGATAANAKEKIWSNERMHTNYSNENE